MTNPVKKNVLYPSDEIPYELTTWLVERVRRTRLDCTRSENQRKRLVFGLLGCVMSMADYLEVSFDDCKDFITGLSVHKATSPDAAEPLSILADLKANARSRS